MFNKFRNYWYFQYWYLIIFLILINIKCVMLSIKQKGSTTVTLSVSGNSDEKYKISGNLTEDIEVNSGSEVVFSNLESDKDHNFTSSLAGVSRLNIINSRAYLSLAEVQLLNDDSFNFAPSGVATQSTTGFGGLANRAIDGNTNQFWTNGSITHTNNSSFGWWELNMPTPVNANKIVIYNRIDTAALADRLRGSILTIYNQDDEIILEQRLTKASIQSYSF